ncbi:MAG TPA: transcriptional repressor LexA [Opitutales bacterium]|nr:transcriptional repressor LexA [Opitutales bacterium]
MKDLTLRQQEILGYIQLHNREQGYWPSIRDIQTHFKFASTNAVMGHLRALERKGAISRVPGQARAFRVTHSLDESAPPEQSFEVVDIPVYGSIAAGYPDGVEPGGAIGRLQIDVNTAGIRRARRAFALKVRGDSMIDAAINDGDIVIFEQAPAKDGDIVAALIDGETTLKRFVQKPGRHPFLKAENPHYPQLHPVSELVIQGIAKAVVRSL